MTAQNDRTGTSAEDQEPTWVLDHVGDGEPTGVLAPAEDGDSTRVFDHVEDGEPAWVLAPAEDGDSTRVFDHVEDGEPAWVLAPAEDGDSTRVFDHVGDGDSAWVLAPGEDGGSTRVFDHVEDGDSTWALAPAEDGNHTRLLAPADEHARSDEHATSDEPRSADAEYSATVLASHWIQRPEPDATLHGPFSTEIPPTPPDRAEGTMLRFGPGVTAALAHRTHRTLPAVPPPLAPPRRRRLRRHALPALVLISVLALLAWQRLGPSVAVRTAAVTARPTVLGCGDTAEIVGLVATNGRPGTLSYRWIRSDGTASGTLREVVVKGQRQARLHLLWTFQGKGRYAARVELRILSPTNRTVTTDLTYRCP
ncbi:hypothetical protein PV728_40475 [Streptomyces europaeiscabiei]|uniref:hypothetical protein n=1 Tax=Streptomyces europaeiscabiei TaxID=146819 RepID=UPI0029AC0225|nr:hypothetical protein [Streptomyces europaeiscabiei]MDX3636393.1 hypothetical protein [Streptomyces europaeiscabiei]MDX3654512.1 hypothetical protein [Streptomyces europaeiscabiei]